MVRRKWVSLTIAACAGIFALAACGQDGGNEKETTTTKQEETKKTEEETTVDLSKLTYENESEDEFKQEVLTHLVGKNPSADKIVFDLDFSTSVNSSYVKFYVVDTDLVTEKGALNTADLEENEEIVIMAKYRKEQWYYKLTLLENGEASKYRTDYAAETLLHNTDNIRGNITLLETVGENSENRRVEQ